MRIYDKMMAVFGAMRRSIAGKADMLNIAPRFSPVMKYVPGMMTVYESELYVCTAKHYGAWDQSRFSRATVYDSVSRMAANESLARPYEFGVEYEQGDLVVKDGLLCRCVIGGVGATALFAAASVEELMKAQASEIGGLRDAVSELESRVSRLEAALSNPVDATVQTPSDSVASEWRQNCEYRSGMMAYHAGRLYCAIDTHVSGTEWDRSKWTPCTVAEVVEGLTSAVSDSIRSIKAKK